MGSVNCAPRASLRLRLRPEAEDAPRDVLEPPTADVKEEPPSSSRSEPHPQHGVMSAVRRGFRHRVDPLGRIEISDDDSPPPANHGRPNRGDQMAGRQPPALSPLPVFRNPPSPIDGDHGIALRDLDVQEMSDGDDAHGHLNETASVSPSPPIDQKADCLDTVVSVFPDICLEHFSMLYDTVSHSSQSLIEHVLENIDQGKPYPKARETKSLKRKRSLSGDEEVLRRFDSAGRPPNLGIMRTFVRNILSYEFKETPMTFIDACLRNSGFHLFATYRILDEAERTFDPNNPPYHKMKSERKGAQFYKDNDLDVSIAIEADPSRSQILKELKAARGLRKKADAAREEKCKQERKEEMNLSKAQAEGTMLDCQCCFGDYPANRMVHCCNEDEPHWFCRSCARQTAETLIGLSKYELICMATDGCTASFSLDQRSQFLDEKTTIALDRNEQEANLRMAGIENLASCPFCPYAAEYPPVEVNKEFTCEAPDCGRVSCRLCRLESHIPKSCEEHSKEKGLSVRRQIEEAMSSALIRKCNKCGTPFVKQDGCNKMTCTGCHNIQCYICSKSCTYEHFDDRRWGGKADNCPLFDSTTQRHENDVKKAEKEALERILVEHPEVSEEALKIKVSKAVLDDEKRRTKNEVPHPLAIQRGRAPNLGHEANRRADNNQHLPLRVDRGGNERNAMPHLQDPVAPHNVPPQLRQDMWGQWVDMDDLYNEVAHDLFGNQPRDKAPRRPQIVYHNHPIARPGLLPPIDYQFPDHDQLMRWAYGPPLNGDQDIEAIVHEREAFVDFFQYPQEHE